MGETFCVLQMPRGNLEVVSPRALVLAAIADALLVSPFAHCMLIRCSNSYGSASARTSRHPESLHMVLVSTSRYLW